MAPAVIYGELGVIYGEAGPYITARVNFKRVPDPGFKFSYQVSRPRPKPGGGAGSIETGPPAARQEEKPPVRA